MFFGLLAEKNLTIQNSNWFESALGETVFMTGLERNGDVVEMASYALLFNLAVKKKRSTVLKENLQSALASKNQEVEVVIDVNHGDLQFLKREGVNLFLIPEDIASYIDYSGINMEECFKLTHDEYENGNVDRIVKYIEKN